jgi:hypothetical protein
MNIEYWISNNAGEFNAEEPGTDHARRFEERLKIHRHHKIRARRRMMAASVMAGLITGTIALVNWEPRQPQMCEYSDEMLEIQAHYGSCLNAKAEQVQKYLADIDANTRTEVMQDVMQIITEAKTFPQNSCNSSGNDAIAIMAEFYQTRISALQYMISFFEDNRQNYSQAL